MKHYLSQEERTHDLIFFVFIAILLVFFMVLLIHVSSAQENCAGDVCLVETNITSETGKLPDNYNTYEEIDCDNFKWVETYIKESLNNKTMHAEDTTIVNLLKQANYGLQDDLNECKSLMTRRYISAYAAFFLFIVCIVLVVWNYFLVRRK